MKYSCLWSATVGLLLPCQGAQLAHEPFDYTLATSLTTRDGGSGWVGAWYQDGDAVVIGAAGLSFTDAPGNALEVGGKCADTTGATTTRNLRVLAAGQTNNAWISFLWRLPASNGKFEGVSFYRGTQQAFTVSNPSTTTTSRLFLTSNLPSGSNVNSQKGDFGTTHLVVLKMTKGGGTGGADRVDLFIDPLLASTPSSPDAVINGSNFDIDRVRIAGQDGATVLVDELRVGETFEDVVPYSPVGSTDRDGDGLSDSQEAVLGLDPSVNNSVLIQAIRAHPDWFNLYSDAGILSLSNGGVLLAKTGAAPVDFMFEVQRSETLSSWSALETFRRQVILPAGKNFLRVTIEGR